MNMDLLDRLNGLSPAAASEQFQRCCGSSWWCEQMAASRPYDDWSSVTAAADEIFDRMPTEAWLEAFASHPRIGDMASLRMKFAGNKEWSAGEQAGAENADEQTLERLATANQDYESRFGYIFIVCATGKSASEMLTLLEERIGNEPNDELPNAAAEQRKITHLRLEKMRHDHPAKEPR